MIEQPRLFAEIDASNIVVRIIAADQEFINSGAVGDPTNWVESFYPIEYDMWVQRERPATIGGTYDSSLDEFLDHPSHAEDLATKATLASEM